MERVLFNLHSQVCTMALQKTSSRVRSLTEKTLLLAAVCGFGVLVISHLSFVHRQSTPSQQPNWGRHRPPKSIPRTCLFSIPGFRQDADLTHIVLTQDETSFAYTVGERAVETADNATCNSSGTTGIESSLATTLNTTFSLSYSRTKGFLLLTPELCSRHHISTQYIHVAMTDARCFGEPFLQTMVFHILGPDTVVLNWLLAVYDSQGYINNPRTKRMLDLNDYASPLWGRAQGVNEHYQYQLVFKMGVILTSLFLFFITTTLVSFTLRETQDRMLAFTFQLQAHVQTQRPLAQLVFTHVVENLVFVPVMVGMMFFLIEFYGGDKFLAFMVLSVVWVCEVFSIVCLRTTQGMQFFPKIFFLLFTAFHVYFFSCPFGFSYTALASTVWFMIHSMMFFWHRYELPAVARGLVTLERPRMSVVSPDSNASLPVIPDDLDDHTETRLLARRNGLARHHGHERSYTSMSTLGRTGLPGPPTPNGFPPDEDEDDDGDGSYMYFMDGEVVMHRDERGTARTPSPITIVGASTGGSQHSQNDLADFQSDDRDEALGLALTEIPRRILTTSSVIEHEEALSHCANEPSISSASLEGLIEMSQSDGAVGTPVRASVSSEQDPRATATPRVDNLSTHVHEHVSESAPLFPFPKFGR